jgi:hypothetical protein
MGGGSMPMPHSQLMTLGNILFIFHKEHIERPYILDGVPLASSN